VRRLAPRCSGTRSRPAKGHRCSTSWRPMRRRPPLHELSRQTLRHDGVGEPEAAFTATRARIGTDLPPGGNHSLWEAAWANSRSTAICSSWPRVGLARLTQRHRPCRNSRLARIADCVRTVSDAYRNPGREKVVCPSGSDRIPPRDNTPSGRHVRPDEAVAPFAVARSFAPPKDFTLSVEPCRRAGPRRLRRP
jgi:hypothetical protein